MSLKADFLFFDSLKVTKTDEIFFLLILYILVFIPIFYLSYINIGFEFDDALIYLRYIKNFLDEKGLVYNPGVYFNGLTSPLYPYLMILAAYITDIKDLHLLSIVLSACFFSLAALTSALLFFPKRNIWHFILIAVLGSFPYFYSIYGMETPLFIFLIALCLYFYQNNIISMLGITGALLLLARLEGIFLLIPMVYFYLKNHKKIPELKYFVLPVLIILANYTFNKIYYNSFLPSTGMAKIWQGKSGLWGEGWAFLNIKYLFGMIDNNIFFISLLIFPLLGLIFKKIEEIDLIILIFLILYSCFYIFLNIPNYNWYYAPYFSLGLCYVVKGASCLFQKIYLRNRLLAAMVTLLPVVIIVLYGFQISNAHNGHGSHLDYQKIGLWLKENTPQSAKIAMVEVGTVGWYSDRYIIDVLGLVNPHNAQFIGEKKFTKWLEFYNPDYFLVHNPLWGHEISAKVLIKNNWYKEDSRFNFPGYLLLKRIVQNQAPITEQDMYINENLNSNPIYFTITSPTIEGPVIAGGNCALDTINGVITKMSTIARKDPLVIGGWAADIISGKIPSPVIARLTQVDNSTVFYATISDRIFRPDVAAHFKNPAIEKSGFNFTASLNEIPSGHYVLEFLQPALDKVLLCADQGRIIIQ